MRVNWTDFDKPGFKDGVVRPFIKYVRWMGVTGGKGSLTQGVHCEFMVGSETIRPHFTQRVHGGYFQKVPTNLPSKNPPDKV